MEHFIINSVTFCYIIPRYLVKMEIHTLKTCSISFWSKVIIKKKSQIEKLIYEFGVSETKKWEVDLKDLKHFRIILAY